MDTLTNNFPNIQPTVSTSATQPLPQQSPKPNFLPIILTALICSLLFGFFGYFLGSKLLNSKENENKTLNKPTPTLTLQIQDPTLTVTNIINQNITPTSIKNGFKTYENVPFGFKLQIPQSMKIKNELNDQYNRFVALENDNLYVEIHLRQTTDTNTFDPNKYFHMDMPVSEIATLGGQLAGLYKAPNGYCDGPGCSKPYVSIVTKHNNDIYALSFFGDAQLSDEEKAIYQSFVFDK